MVAKLDRRWVSCGNQAMCNTMVSVPSPRLVEIVSRSKRYERETDRAWLAENLKRFGGPPSAPLALVGTELRALEEHEIEEPIDYYATLLRVPLPNSLDPSMIFPVGRLAFSTAAALRDFEMLKREVRALAQALVLHEVDEWLFVDGEHVRNPHPELVNA